jgi:hypothetical protein
VDVLARGNEALDRLEAWEPFARRYRARPTTEDPYECGGYLGDLDDFAGGLPHYNYAGEQIPFREALANARDPHHYHVGETYVRTARGLMRVSTIFSGVEWGPSWTGQPLLYETMVESEHHGWIYQQRWFTLDQAVDGHRQVGDALAQSWWLNLGGRA